MINCGFVLGLILLTCSRNIFVGDALSNFYELMKKFLKMKIFIYFTQRVSMERNVRAMDSTSDEKK